MAILLLWTHTGLPADGFNVYVSADPATPFAFLLDAGNPADRSVELDPFEIEAEIGESVHAFFAMSAYASGVDESDLSNVVKRRVWGADLDRDGRIGILDAVVFAFCFYVDPRATLFACQLADFTDNETVDAADWLQFASLWR